MKILFLDIYKKSNSRISKDTAGGYGTENSLGDSFIGKTLSYFTKKTIENNDYSNLNNKFNYLCNTQHIFIPIIYSRGIISRSIMYMLALYGNENYINYIIDYDIMLKWNIKYPPCDREIERNEKIFLLQGNKNPFINEYKV